MNTNPELLPTYKALSPVLRTQTTSDIRHMEPILNFIPYLIVGNTQNLLKIIAMTVCTLAWSSRSVNH